MSVVLWVSWFGGFRSVIGFMLSLVSCFHECHGFKGFVSQVSWMNAFHESQGFYGFSWLYRFGGFMGFMVS